MKDPVLMRKKVNENTVRVLLYRSPSVKISSVARPGVAQWIECHLWARGSLVQFPVRAHTWVAGGPRKGDHTSLFLSLSFSLPSPLSKNK